MKVMRCRIVCGLVWTLLIAVSLVAAAGCEKWSHNGDLDGQWQVMEVTHSGEPVQFPEGERFYYNFYLHTFSLGFTDVRPTWLRGNFEYAAEEGRLYLDFPYVREGRLSEEWLSRLVYWGVPVSGVMDTRLLELSSSRLVMAYDDVVIVCRKF